LEKHYQEVTTLSVCSTKQTLQVNHLLHILWRDGQSISLLISIKNKDGLQLVSW